MNFSKKHLIPGLIGNLVVFILGLVGISMLFAETYNYGRVFVYFTFLSNLLVTLVSFVGAILYFLAIRFLHTVFDFRLHVHKHDFLLHFRS